MTDRYINIKYSSARNRSLARTALLMLLTFVLTLAFAGCAAEKPADSADDGRLKVVCTVFPQYDFVRNIVGDRADVQLLVKPGSEVHGFEPTIGDIIKIGGCDLLVYVSGASEQWVTDTLDALGDDAPDALEMVSVVETVEEELVEGMEPEEEEEGEEEGETDEHVWTSPKRAIQIVAALRDRLCAADPGNADAYRANADIYTGKLAALDELLEQTVSGGARRTILVADRFPFRYLADDYGLEYYAAFAGCASETDPSLATIAFLINKAEEQGMPCIFHIEFSRRTVSEKISEATGAKELLLHSCHNLTKEEFARGEDYISLMTANAANLKEALA